MGTSYAELTHSLSDAFNTLADEAQGLNDRRIVLEHKLRFAHEQLQYLADKYAPGSPEITETLAKLQLPPHSSVNDDSPVPLPRRNSPPSQHELALVIRDGRRVASKLASVGEASKTTESTRYSFSQMSPDQSSMSTALEQDFTVEGRKGNLQCPFSKPAPVNPTTGEDAHEDASPQHDESQHERPLDTADPICATMAEDMTSQSAGVNGTGGSKCPIRYMDQHSPEEIAHYVETHKHDLPRSHNVCLRRYQQNEQQIKKLDSKYGNIVSMIEGLGQLHQPMLPESDQDRPRRPSEVERASNERVHDWANAVTVTADTVTDEEVEQDDADDRQSHFDRPLKEVRVGESPSRPWGIHVPVQEPSGFEDIQPFSPPPAPVRMPSTSHSARSTPVKAGGGKCPFDHTRLPAMVSGAPPSPPNLQQPNSLATPPAAEQPAFIPVQDQIPHAQSPSPLAQPAFIDPALARKGSASNAPPQMVFTGPVFIGYPIDQALQIINQYRQNNE